VVGLGLLWSAERKRVRRAEQRDDGEILKRRGRHPAGDDRRGDPGQVLALESLRPVLSGRMRDFVPEDGGERGLVSCHGRMAVYTTIFPPGRQ